MVDGKVTINQVYSTLIEVRDQLKHLNGTVRQNCLDIAILQERQEGDKGNWSKVWGVLQPILVAAITAAVLRAAP